MTFDNINFIMTHCLDMADTAFKEGEVPVGCVITDSSGEVLAKTANTKEKNQNACNHAEVLAITEASKKISSWRLNDCSLFVTLEPCVMCMGAIVQARIKNLYFGAYDPKGGAISLGFKIHNHDKLNHKVNTYGGYKQIECAKVLTNFFKLRRKQYK